MTKASIQKILHKQVSIRRLGIVERNVQTHLLISGIKQGKLKKDDEISTDEKIWVRLDQHSQLSSYFPNEELPSESNLPLDLNHKLLELSKMLKDLS
jgi:hypothetical protein